MDRIQRFVFIHRRSLAAVAAGAAVFFALGAVQSDGVPVTVAARDLSSGHVLRADDLRTVRFDPSSVPDGIQASEALTGRSVAGPVRAGEPLTDRRVLEPSSLEGYAVKEPRLTSIRIADPSLLVGLRVGDRVDVVAVDHEAEPVVVATDVVVAALPQPDAESVTVSVVTSDDAALQIVAASARNPLAILTRPSSLL